MFSAAINVGIALQAAFISPLESPPLTSGVDYYQIENHTDIQDVAFVGKVVNLGYEVSQITRPIDHCG